MSAATPALTHDTPPRIGALASGALDAITDVPGVTVGHATHASGDVQTGVTVVHAHGQDPYRHKVPAGVAVINGFGKSVGLLQLEELGQLAAGVVLDALALAFDPLVLALALLPEAGQAALAAGGDAALVAFEILAHHQLVAAEGEGALGEHHVAFEDVDSVLVVDRHPVGLDVDGLAAVGPFGVGRGGGEHGFSFRGGGRGGGGGSPAVFWVRRRGGRQVCGASASGFAYCAVNWGLKTQRTLYLVSVGSSSHYR